MKKYFILFVFVISGLSLAAQTKTLTIAELVNNQLPADFKQNLPVFVKWMSDDQVMLKLTIPPAKEPTNYVLDIASGQYIPATPEQLRVRCLQTNLYLLGRENYIIRKGHCKSK
jgi:hypothetical protein